MAEKDEHPTILEYGSPKAEETKPGVNPLAAIALCVGVFAMVTAWTGDPGGQNRQFQVFFATWGAVAGLLLGFIALFRLVLRYRGRWVDLAVAAMGLACSVAGIFGAITRIRQHGLSPFVLPG